MSYKNLQKNKGFTLLETLIAVFILVMVLNSAFTLMSNNLFGARFAKNQMTADYLMQEVVDSIRNDRDTFIQHQDWVGFLNKYGLSGGRAGGVLTSSCMIDVSPKSPVTQCSSLVNGRSALPPSVMYYDANNTIGSYYTIQSDISGVVATSFKRSVDLTLVGTDEVDITVTVTWNEGSNPHSRKLYSSLLNWQ